MKNIFWKEVGSTIVELTVKNLDKILLTILFTPLFIRGILLIVRLINILESYLYW